MDRAKLKTELTDDPQGLGYAAVFASNDDLALLPLLNTRNASTCPRESLPREELVKALLPVYLALDGAADKIKAKWDRILPSLTSLNTTDPQSADMQAIFAALVTDGLWSEVPDSLVNRPCSRSEVVDVPGAAATIEDVNASLPDAVDAARRGVEQAAAEQFFANTKAELTAKAKEISLHFSSDDINDKMKVPGNDLGDLVIDAVTAKGGKAVALTDEEAAVVADAEIARIWGAK